MLQQRLLSLQQANAAQDGELSRLRTEALALAARTAAASGGGPVRRGVSGSSSADDAVVGAATSVHAPTTQDMPSQQQGSPLQPGRQVQQLADLQEQLALLQGTNEWLQTQLGADAAT